MLMLARNNMLLGIDRSVELLLLGLGSVDDLLRQTERSEIGGKVVVVGFSNNGHAVGAHLTTNRAAGATGATAIILAGKIEGVFVVGLNVLRIPIII